ncbi:MAG: hypothetical protein ACRBDI_04210 [Alphaproteobacteria bacterium]
MSDDIERGRLQGDFNILQNLIVIQQDNMSRQMNSFAQAVSLEKYDVVENCLDNLLKTAFLIKNSLGESELALLELASKPLPDIQSHALIPSSLDKIVKQFEQSVAEYGDKKEHLQAAISEVERAITTSEFKKRNGMPLSEENMKEISKAFKPFISDELKVYEF